MNMIAIANEFFTPKLFLNRVVALNVRTKIIATTEFHIREIHTEKYNNGFLFI